MGIEALGSPIALQAMKPPFTTISGFTPKNAGFHSTRSANFPGSIEPISRASPCVIAGLIVYLATYRLARKLSLRLESCSSGPRCVFILCAVCQVRITTSPIRPIACESLESMLSTPMSCRISSAAIVSGRMRLSAKATSSGTSGFRWWQTISMSRCSAIVLTVYGRVGFVEEGITFGNMAMRMMSGAWPPPAPSV